MMGSGVIRAMGIVLAVAVLCGAAAGCVSDLGAQTADNSGNQLRYYGGPKSPMWPAQ